MVALWTAHAQLSRFYLVENQALHENTKVRGPGVEAKAGNPDQGGGGGGGG